MEIEIEKVKSLINTKYYINDSFELLYKGVKKFNWLSPKIEVIDSSLKRVLTIIRPFNFFNPSYNIKIGSHEWIPLKCSSSLKDSYTCTTGQDNYNVIEHKRRKTSIFKNKSQIAYFQKKRISVLGYDKYNVVLDKNANTLLIIGIIISIDMRHDKIYEHDSGIIFNIGKLSENTSFDENWTPK